MMRHVTATTAAPAQQLGGNDKPAPTDDVFAMLLGMFATTSIVDVPVDAAPASTGKPAAGTATPASSVVAALPATAAPTATAAPAATAASASAKPAALPAGAATPPVSAQPTAAPSPAPAQPAPSAGALMTDAKPVNTPDVPKHEVLSVAVESPRPTTTTSAHDDKKTKLDGAESTQHHAHHGPEPTAAANDTASQNDSRGNSDRSFVPVAAETHHDAAPKPAEPDPTTITAAATPVDAAQPAGQTAPSPPPATAPPPAEGIAIQAMRLQERGGGRTHVVMRVDPPEIGPVVVSLSVTDSSVEVALHVEDPAAAAALDAQRDAIQQALEANGLSLQQFSVGADARQFGQQDNRPDRRMARTVTAPAATEAAPTTETREGVWL